MQINSKPTPYSFAGNLADIVIQSSQSIELTLWLNDVQVLVERYDSMNDIVRICLRDLLLKITPRATIDSGSVPIAEYRYKLVASGDLFEDSFRCVAGGHGTKASASAFMQANWLTWQPQSLRTSYHTPQRLVYAALNQSSVMLSGYFADGSAQTVEHSELQSDRLYTIDTTYGTLCEMFSKQPLYIDIWVVAEKSSSYTQRYYLSLCDSNADLFMWYNSLGGIDTVNFTGDRVERTDLTVSSGVFDSKAIDYDVEAWTVYTKYTGYIPDENERMWVLDFFRSSLRYHIEQGERHEIVVSKQKTEHKRGEMAGYEFDFAQSDQTVFLNLPRYDRPVDLEIVSPGDEVFFLAPRLNEFKRVDLSAGEVLIPCQYAAQGEWLAMTLSDIYNEIRGRDGEDAFFVAVFSENGNMAINGEVSNTLFAEVYRGDENVTATIAQNLFSWRRKSANPEGDIVWNELHTGVGSRIEINRDDVFRKAVFECFVALDGYVYKSN